MAPAGEIDQQTAAARERQRAVVVVRGGGEIVAAAPIVRERGPGREVRDADRSEAVGPDAPLAEHELRPGAQRGDEEAGVHVETHEPAAPREGERPVFVAVLEIRPVEPQAVGAAAVEVIRAWTGDATRDVDQASALAYGPAV